MIRVVVLDAFRVRKGLIPFSQFKRTCSSSSCRISGPTSKPTAAIETQPWLLHSIQGLQQRDQTGLLQGAHMWGMPGRSSGRGLALAAVAHITGSPPGTPDANVSAASSANKLHDKAKTPSAAWQHVLHLLQQHAAQVEDGDSGAAPQERQQQQQEEVGAALQAAGADKTGPSAQQLLSLLTMASDYQHHEQQLLVQQLLPFLCSATVASLQQLPLHHFAEVLLLLGTLQSSSSSSSRTGVDFPCDMSRAPTVGSTKQQQRQHTGALTKAIRVYLQQHQQAMDAASTAAVAAALAACRQRSSFTILSMLALEHMEHMTPAQLLQLLQAFAEVQHYNRAVCDAAAQQAAQAVKSQGFRLLQPAGPSSSSGAQDGTAAATIPQQQQQQQHSRWTACQLTGLLQALSRLRHYDPSLLEATCTCLLRSPQRIFGDVVAVVHSCAVLNHFNQPLFETAVEMAKRAMQAQHQQPTQEHGNHTHLQQHQQQEEDIGSDLAHLLAELAWACGVMGYWQGADFVRQLFVWSAQVDVKKLPQEQLLLWHQVQTSLTDAALLRPQASPDGLSSSLIVAAQAAWARRQQGRRLTAFQKEVVEALQQAGVRCKLNVALDGPVVVDVALMQRQVGARYRVALQLHPQEDFAANPPHGALGPTAARWRALQARGWRVVTLQQSEWRLLKTKQQQVEYAWELSQGVEVSAPGMSHLVHQVVVDKDEKDKAKRKTSLPKTLLRILLEGH